MIGIFSGEEVFDGVFEERQPMVKLSSSHIGFGDELSVYPNEISFIGSRAEEDGLPKVIHLRKMGLPVDLSYFVKDDA